MSTRLKVVGLCKQTDFQVVRCINLAAINFHGGIGYTHHELTHDDAYAAFQNSYVVYHDDLGDYSTNEPTMDGTACAIMLLAYFAQVK